MISERLKRAREANHFSQRKIASLVGVSQAAYSKWELGEIVPKEAIIVRLAELLGVSVDYLNGIEDITFQEEVNNTESFYSRFERLCVANNFRPSSQTALQITGVSSTAITNWKVRNNVPRPEVLNRIAEYFNVSTDYLLGKTDDTRRDNKKGNIEILVTRQIKAVPLYETVSAGFGCCPSNNIIDYVPVFIENPNDEDKYIAIKVRGDSMYPKIEDGDNVIVRKQDEVGNGDIAVVIVDGDEGYVKRVEYGTDSIFLESINPTYPTMKYKNADLSRVKVVGKVTQIIKKV